MSDIDMTGWTPNTGERPVDPDATVYVLLEGHANKGPRHSGPAAARVYVWAITTPEPDADPLLTPNNILGWCREADFAKAAVYPHARSDLGR